MEDTCAVDLAFKSSMHDVLNTVELLSLILSFLDELSLARATAINKRIRDVMLTTKSLRGRLGLYDSNAKVIDTSETSQDDYRQHDGLHWNPLLDWFTSRTISVRASSTPQGPIGNSKEFVIFHILPHALKALKNKNSIVHKMYITIPPVTTIRMHFIMKNTPKWPVDWMSRGYEMSWPSGITFAHLLDCWADREPTLPRNMTLAVGIYIRPPNDVEQEVELKALTAMGEEWMLYPNVAYAKKEGEPDFQAPGLPTEVVRDYINATWSANEDPWFEMSRREQDVFMRNLLVKQAQKTRPHWDALLKEDRYAMWPALGLPEAREDDGMKKAPYEVEYAAGLVFNRQD